MKNELRKIAIYNLIKSNKVVSVKTLSNYFDVSEMTIRRDLDELERSQLIRRRYGSATIIDDNVLEPDIETRMGINVEAKEKIAALAARFTEHINSFYVDGSSTALQFLRHVPLENSYNSYSVYTDDLNAFEYLRNFKNIRLYLIGGFLNKDNHSFNTGFYLEMLKRIYVDATFSSCSGFATEGLYDNTVSTVQNKRVLRSNAGSNYILADSSKLNNRGILIGYKWDKGGTLVTDQPLDEAFVSEVEARGARVIWDAAQIQG